MKTLPGAVRLAAIIAFLVASCAEGQQPPLAPGTPATAAPQASPAPQPTPAPETTTTKTTLQNQNDATSATPSLYGPWSLEPFYWFTRTTPSLRGGAKALDFENLNYPGHGKYTPGVSLSIPVSRTGMLNFSGFISKGSTNTVAPQNLDLFGTTYAAGDLVTANYTIKDFKLSLQDLFFPFPRKDGQKWRIKTLWEVQYASVSTNINAPFAPATDSAGNALVHTASGTRYVVYPTFGLAGEYHFTRNLMLEVKGSGFTIPHRSTIGDAEGSISYRMGAVELVAADRYYHFKTSVQNAEYFKVTLMGPYVALRLYPSQVSIPCLFCRRKTVAANTSTSSSSAKSESPSSPPNESTVSTPTSQSNSSSSVNTHNYVRRFSAGATLSVLGLSLIKGATNTVTNSSTMYTSYQTTGASSRIGYGATAHVLLTDHFAVDISGFLRRIGYQLNTTVTTNSPALVSGVVTTVTTSTILHEDTRARLIDIPGVVRYYAHGRHEPGPHWFFEGGGAWRKVDSIRTSTNFTNASSVLSCCTTTPAAPAHSSVFGIVAGGGVQLIDAFGVRIVPEVRYTRWMSPVFHAFTTNTQQNEVAAGFSITF